MSRMRQKTGHVCDWATKDSSFHPVSLTPLSPGWGGNKLGCAEAHMSGSGTSGQSPMRGANHASGGGSESSSSQALLVR